MRSVWSQASGLLASWKRQPWLRLPPTEEESEAGSDAAWTVPHDALCAGKCAGGTPFLMLGSWCSSLHHELYVAKYIYMHDGQSIAWQACLRGLMTGLTCKSHLTFFEWHSVQTASARLFFASWASKCSQSWTLIVSGIVSSVLTFGKHNNKYQAPNQSKIHRREPWVVEQGAEGTENERSYSTRQPARVTCNHSTTHCGAPRPLSGVTRGS